MCEPNVDCGVGPTQGEKAMFKSTLTHCQDNHSSQAKVTAIAKPLAVLAVSLSLASCAHPEGNEEQAAAALEWCDDQSMALDTYFDARNGELIVACRDNRDSIVTFYLGGNGKSSRDDDRRDPTGLSRTPDDAKKDSMREAGAPSTASENIWVTFNNVDDVPISVRGSLRSANPEVQKLINEFDIGSVEQAVPSSRQEALRKVYDVECLCDADALSARIRESSSALSRPEIAPKYRLLNDPDDYDTTGYGVFTQDYALDLINAKGAWNYTTGNQRVVLGISDGDFFQDHEELETEIEAINTTGTAPLYYFQHGTAVATTAGGATNNQQGKSSIGYDCKLSLTSMNYDRVLEMSSSGVRVINMSWAAGCYSSPYVQEIVNEAYQNGAILVASAGNGGTCGGPTNLVYPASHEHVISVSSVGPWDNHERTIGDPLTTHQHNGSVDITAPGYDVALTVSPGWYLTGNGTSFAAPYVTGTIGLMLSIKPCLTFHDVVDILESTAVNIDAQNPSYIGQLGAGRLDAKAAVGMAEEFSCDPVPGGTSPEPPSPTVAEYLKD